MTTIMKNTFNVFKKNKEFIMAVIIQPILLFLLMSVLLPYTKEHSIGICNQSENTSSQRIVSALSELDGVRTEIVDKDDLEDKMMNSNIEIAVVIADVPQSPVPVAQVISLSDNEIKSAVEALISGIDLSSEVKESTVTVNEVAPKGINITNTLAFMIFKTLTAASLLGLLIITERKNKMRDRIFLSGISKGAYLGGMSIVYLLCMMLGTTLFYIIGLIFNFDFGMQYSFGYLIMMYLADLLSVAIYIFASSVTKSEDGLWIFSAFILMPMALFSGILFPYEFMPQAMQMIGSCFPHRWIAKSIEIMQKTGSIADTVPNIALLLGLSFLLFAIGAIKTKKTTQN